MWLIPVLAVLAAGVFLCWHAMRNRHDMAVTLAERVRTTALYRQLYPILQECEGRCVEQIKLRRTEVVIRMFRPYKEVIRFGYAAHGLDEVENADVLQALAQGKPVFLYTPGLPESPKNRALAGSLTAAQRELKNWGVVFTDGGRKRLVTAEEARVLRSRGALPAPGAVLTPLAKEILTGGTQ